MFLSPRFPIPQGTLDMLILQIVSLEPVHGYGIAPKTGPNLAISGPSKSRLPVVRKNSIQRVFSAL
jgi:hypothetical protein